MFRFARAALAHSRVFAGGLVGALLLGDAAIAADGSGLVAVKLNSLWIAPTGSAHYLLTSDPQATTSAGSTIAVAYLASAAQQTSGAPLPDMQPLYRLVNGNSWRAGIDTSPAEGTTHYDSKVALGYLWPAASALPGMKTFRQIQQDIRAVSRSADRHSTSVGMTAYAFPRDPAGERLIPVSGGGVTVKSNAAAGGAVWEWWWHGKEFINDFDYGRQLSMAVYCETGEALQEAGDKYGTSNIPVYSRHPSPTAYVRNVGADRQSTRAIPIEWTPDDHGGGRDNAVLYANARVGKNLTLDWQGPDGVDRDWPLALYESVYEGPAFVVANVEAPTAYLNAEFSTYYKYDAKSDSLTPVACNHSKVNISGGGADGLILASGPGPDALAMGVYKNDPNAGIVLYDDAGPTTGHYDPSFSKWGIVYRSAVASKWSFRSWIVTDSVQNIKKDFHQLYLWGVTSRDLPVNAAR